MILILKTEEGLETCFNRTIKNINIWIEKYMDKKLEKLAVSRRLMSERTEIHNINEGHILFHILIYYMYAYIFERHYDVYY